MIDEFTFRQSADILHNLLHRALDEPSEDNQEMFLRVLRHYLLQGLRVQLTHDAVIVSRRQAQLAQQSKEAPSCQVSLS